MIRTRHQLPVYSPLRAGDLLRIPLDLLRGAAGERLTTELRDRLGADDVRLCGSGTDALRLAIEQAGRLRGEARGAVALPAFCCYDVATAAVGTDRRIALYDVDPETLAPDPDSFARVLRSGATVAVVAPLYGIPVAWGVLEELAAASGAFLVEDAAQGHGADWSGRRLGGLGELSVVSFGRGKGWTGGRGGALLARRGASLPTSPVEDAAVPFADEVVSYGTAWAQWVLGRPVLYAVPMSIPGLGLGETRYREPSPPRGMLRMSPPLLLRSRVTAEREIAVRRRNAERLLEAAAAAPGTCPIRIPSDSTPGYLRLPLRLSGGMGSLPEPARARRLGVAPSYPTTLAALPAVRDRLVGPQDRWPGAERLVSELVTLPTHSRLAAEELAALSRLLLRIG